MPAVRQISYRHFRGFDDFTTKLPANAVLVGEPGAGRSDLIEGLIRVLDGDYWRSRRGDELDFHDLDHSKPAEVELVIGALNEPAQEALAYQLELWDSDEEVFVGQLADPSLIDPKRHEPVVRLSYRLSLGEDGRLDEMVFWTKFGVDDPKPIRTSERQFLPFLWQRGWSSRPLDLAGRGDLRELIDVQDGPPFEEAVTEFLAAVGEAAKVFSEHERVGNALDELLGGLRQVRRFDPEAPASEILRFLPDGGANSGLLKSLAAAITLRQGPTLMPVARHGSSVGAALRGGLLLAGAKRAPGAIVAIDELSSDLDPALAGYMARQLRNCAGQLVMSSHSSAVAQAFEVEEIVRLYWQGAHRTACIGRRPTSKEDRIAQRYFAWQILPALSASAIVVTEGLGDRLSIDALVQKTTGREDVPSLDAAAIEVIEATGQGDSAKIAEQAKALGIYTIVLFDNDGAAEDPLPEAVEAALDKADVVLRLPPRTAIERVLINGVPDAELIRVISKLVEAIPGLTLPSGWETFSTKDLRRAVVKLLHDQSGLLHASFVRELDSDKIGTEALDLLRRLYCLATGRTLTGLVGLHDEPDSAA